MSKNNCQKPCSDNKKSIAIVLAWLLAGFGVLIIVVLWFFYIPRLKVESGVFNNKYPFLNPSVEILKQDGLLVDFQQLRDFLINKYENREDFLVSVYFEYLPTGENISVNKDEKIWPASLIKIPVAMAAMKNIQDGKWLLDNELVILDNDKDGDFGKLYLEPSGTTLTIEKLITETLVNSDNTAHFVLLRNLENQEFEEVFAHVGLDDIINALKKAPSDQEFNNSITAKRYSIFFRSLYNATFLNPKYSNLFLDILAGSPKEYLSSGLPDNIKFVHKTGIRDDDLVWADSGIVYVPNRHYLLTVMIRQKNQENPSDREEINKLFRSISEEIYDYVSGL